MPPDDDYISMVRAMGWPELAGLWNQIRDRETTSWQPGRALEFFVLRMFELGDADVTWPYSVLMFDQEIEQIDGAVYWNGMSCLMECKDHRWPLDLGPVAKLRNQLQRRPAGVIGNLISASGFTEPAYLLANFTAPQSIILWDRIDLDRAVAARNATEVLVYKYRYLIENGIAFSNYRKAR